MESFARTLIILGVVLLGIGVLIFALSRAGLPLGQLPGDIRIEGENYSCFIPLATGLLLSLLLTLALNLFNRLF